MSEESVLNSIDKIAENLFHNYILQVNDSFYRFIDIEFYYYSEKVFADIYSHKHEAQLTTGKWYFHGSGMDLTFGSNNNYGGILIRAIAKISSDGEKQKLFITDEIHGPINVKTEICSNLHGAFDNQANTFQLNDISHESMGGLMPQPENIIKTRRIGLNKTKDTKNFHDLKLRYVIFPHLKLKDKTVLAADMQTQFPDMGIEEINKKLGSKFIK